jgi:hypothetical protein
MKVGTCKIGMLQATVSSNLATLDLLLDLLLLSSTSSNVLVEDVAAVRSILAELDPLLFNSHRVEDVGNLSQFVVVAATM